MKNRFVMLILFVILCEIVGGLGTIFTLNSIPTWYNALQKPSFTPPSWVFGPIWTLLYALMGIAAYLVWTKGIKKENVRFALSLFGVQLALNFLWTYLFFGLQSTLYGLIGIIALWLAVFATIIKFYSISRNAAYIMVPYIAWVSIATALSLSLWLLN